jgi:transcriptional regulator with XRE-family HTH domain
MSSNQIVRLPFENTGGSHVNAEVDFARRLHHYMNQQGLSNSDLARAVWGERKNKNGYMEAKGRDRISVYLKGETTPTAKTLQALADALGVEPADLNPQMVKDATDKWEPQSVSLTVAPGHDNMGHLIVDRIIPFKLAAHIITLLSEHDAATGKEV